MSPSEQPPSESSPSESSSGGAAFAPAQEQRWSLYAGFAEAAAGRSAQREIWGWSALAMLSLGVAGVFALLVALSRVPGAAETIPWPVGFFEKGLILHVIFSFVVWFLSVLGGMAALAAGRLSAGAPRWNGLGPAAVALAGLASVLLFVPAWMDRGEASLNNYVPVIIDPVYYAGLMVLALSLTLSVIRLLVNLIPRRGPLEPVSLSVVATGLIYLLALACFALAWLALAGSQSGAITADFNEDLFWGGGHALQFVNVGLMLCAWYVLGGISLGQPLIHPRLMAAVLLILVVSALPAPFFYTVFEPFTFDQALAFTNLQYLLAPPVLLAAGGGVATVWRRRRNGDALPWADPAFLCLALSALVFAIGGVLGLYVDGGDTRTPAHYHGVIGGINLAFMGLFFALFLPLLKRALKRGKAVSASIWLYAMGQVLHSLGLFWAGGYGAPRKVAGADQGLEALGASAGLYLMGVGAVIAVVGGVMFIFMVSKALLKKN